MLPDEMEKLIKENGLENAEVLFIAYHQTVLSQGNHIQARSLMSKWEIAKQMVNPVESPATVNKKYRKRLDNYTSFGDYIIAPFDGAILKDIAAYYEIPYPTFNNQMRTEMPRVSAKIKAKIIVGLVKKTGRHSLTIKKDFADMGARVSNEKSVWLASSAADPLGKFGQYVMAYFPEMNNSRQLLAKHIGLEYGQSIRFLLARDFVKQTSTSNSFAPIRSAVVERSGKTNAEIMEEMKSLKGKV